MGSSTSTGVNGLVSTYFWPSTVIIACILKVNVHFEVYLLNKPKPNEEGFLYFIILIDFSIMDRFLQPSTPNILCTGPLYGTELVRG